MKVAVIYGQQHKGNTWQLTQLLLKKLDCAPSDIREFQTNGMPQCVGCMQCLMKGEAFCPHYAEVTPLVQGIDWADVIVFSTPTYCFDMTGQMKSFMDHMAYRWVIHRPADMSRKIGVVVTTAAGAGTGPVAKMLYRQMQFWTVGRLYRLTFAIWANGWKNVSPARMARLERKTYGLASKINRLAGRRFAAPRAHGMLTLGKKIHAGSGTGEGLAALEQRYWNEYFGAGRKK